MLHCHTSRPSLSPSLPQSLLWHSHQWALWAPVGRWRCACAQWLLERKCHSGPLGLLRGLPSISLSSSTHLSHSLSLCVSRALSLCVCLVLCFRGFSLSLRLLLFSFQVDLFLFSLLLIQSLPFTSLSSPLYSCL